MQTHSPWLLRPHQGPTQGARSCTEWTLNSQPHLLRGALHAGVAVGAQRVPRPALVHQALAVPQAGRGACGSGAV